MGQISGVDASTITSIAGVAVANISYVGSTSAATLGLGGGGGGKVFAGDPFGDSGIACANGPRSISKGGAITLYYNSEENRMYTGAGFTTPFNGGGNYWYNSTDNQWWGTISPEGYVEGYGTCG